jgi:hypothetical protein
MIANLRASVRGAQAVSKNRISRVKRKASATSDELGNCLLNMLVLVYIARQHGVTHA